MIRGARLLYLQRWKDSQVPTMEEWMVNLMELVEMAKPIALVKEKSNFTFNFINFTSSTWKLLFP